MTGIIGHRGLLLAAGGGALRPAQTVAVMKDTEAAGTPASFVDPVGKTWTRSGANASVASDPGGMGGSCILITGSSNGHSYQIAMGADDDLIAGDFTVEAFIRLPTSDPGGLYGTPIVGVPGASVSGWVLRCNTGQLQMVYPGSAALVHNHAWAANTTVHIMACRQGSTHYVGVNGVATAIASMQRTTSHSTLEVGPGSFATMPTGNKYMAVRLVKGVALYPGTSYVVPTGPL